MTRQPRRSSDSWMDWCRSSITSGSDKWESGQNSHRTWLRGVVGNQCGIRSAAMLGFDVPKAAFVATATAVGIIVDAARVPVYLVTQGNEVLGLWPFLVTATVGTLVGTVVGERLLRRVPEPIYRKVVAALVLALGVFMIYQAVR